MERCKDLGSLKSSWDTHLSFWGPFIQSTEYLIPFFHPDFSGCTVSGQLRELWLNPCITGRWVTVFALFCSHTIYWVKKKEEKNAVPYNSKIPPVVRVILTSEMLKWEKEAHFKIDETWSSCHCFWVFPKLVTSLVYCYLFFHPLCPCRLVPIPQRNLICLFSLISLVFSESLEISDKSVARQEAAHTLAVCLLLFPPDVGQHGGMDSPPRAPQPHPAPCQITWLCPSCCSPSDNLFPPLCAALL